MQIYYNYSYSTSLRLPELDQWMPLLPLQLQVQLCRWQFSQKETSWQTFFKRSAILDEKLPFLHFWAPLAGGGLGATYDDHLKLIGKRVADFLLMLLHLIAIGVIRLRRYESLWVQIGDFAPTRAGWLKILGRRGRPHSNHFFFKN